MFEIRNQKDLRINYSWLRLLEGCHKEGGKTESVISQIKQAIRSYNKKEALNLMERRVVKDNGIDGCVMLIELGWFPDKAKASQYFMDHEYIESPNSPYDCTGKAFTSWYKIFKRRGTYFAYHSICLDV